MALRIGLALLGGVHAYLATSSSFNISSPLANLIDPLRVVFIDFDRTLAAGSVGETLLAQWCPDCAVYATPAPTQAPGPTPVPERCGCAEDDTTFASMLAANSSIVLAEGGKIINGTDRRDRLAQTLELLQAKGIDIAILSTSWYQISAAAWRNFIAEVLEIADLAKYIPIDKILTLDDPGLNIPANKTKVIESYLADEGWSKHQGLFVDDSASNIVAAATTIDYLHVFPRDGLSADQLEWIEARANPVNCTALASVANGTVGSCTPSVRTGETCSITCNNGWSLTGEARQTCKATTTTVSAFTATQRCVAATCASPVVVNGTAGTCKNQTTGQSCSITCATNFRLSGGTSQTCLGSGPGTSAYPGNQSCVALPSVCPTTLITVFSNACTNKSISSGCSFTCSTAADALSKEFRRLNGTAQFVETCIRNQTKLSSSNTALVISRLQKGGSICAVNSAQVSGTALFAVVFSVVMVFFTS